VPEAPSIINKTLSEAEDFHLQLRPSNARSGKNPKIKATEVPV